MNASKNHTISKFVAKAALRVVIVLMALPVFMYFTKKESMLQHIVFPNKIALLAPLLLLVLFTGLLILMLRNKYEKLT